MTLQIQKVQNPIGDKASISLSMVRADLIHSLASGNKIYKLMPNIDFAKQHGYTEILSFGGAFSNHIHALALMAKKYKLHSIGIIRGEEKYSHNPTLQDAKNSGMQLEFVSRKDYKCRSDVDYLAELQQQYPNAFIVPEGGSSQLAIRGCAQLGKDINAIQVSDILTIACGTGATAAGLVCGVQESQKIMAYSVLRDKSLTNRIENFIRSKNDLSTRWKVNSADFGGYAKLDEHLLAFIFNWLEQTGILLDPIYTSKMCMKLMQQIEANEFEPGTSICMIHSGGLQGWRGMKRRVISLSGISKWEIIEGYLYNIKILSR